jgi:hypothetical protein
MLNVKTYLIGGAILIVGLFGSSLNAANMKIDGLACKTPRDLDAMTRTSTGACHFIPRGTYVTIEKTPLNGSICVRPLGEIDCFWVYEGQVINR